MSSLTSLSTLSFFKAVETGNLDGVKGYVKTGGDVEARDFHTSVSTGESALMKLASSRCWTLGHSAVFHYLIKNGADVHGMRHFRLGRSSISGGFSRYHLENALHIATKHRHTTMVVLLILARAAPNARNGSAGKTPLHIACEQQYPEVVKILLAHRADPNILAGEDHKPCDTPISFAIANKATTVVAILCASQTINVNLKNFYRFKPISPLMAAVQWGGGSDKSVSHLLMAGAELEDEILVEYGDGGRHECQWITNSLKKGLILQVVKIEGIAKIVLDFAQPLPDEPRPISTRTFVTGPLLQDPRVLLNKEKPKIMKKQRELFLASLLLPPLGQIVSQYEGTTRPDHEFFLERILPGLTKLIWDHEVSNASSDTRTADVNALLEQCSDDIQEKIYIEIFMRSKDPKKTLAASPEEQLEWSKRNSGNDLSILAEILRAWY